MAAAARRTGAVLAGSLALLAAPPPNAQTDAAGEAVVPSPPPTPSDESEGDRPAAGPGCVSVELAAARRSFPPDRIALYSETGGWLGDVVVAPSCPPIVARARVYIADKNKQWGKICARDGPVNTHLWVQDTKCPVDGVVDAREFEGEPPEPIADGLDRSGDTEPGATGEAGPNGAGEQPPGEEAGDRGN